MSGILVIVVLVVVALAVVAAGKAKGGSGSSVGFPYQRAGALFSAAERSFLGVLDQAASPEYRVFGKVRIADLAALKPGLSASAPGCTQSRRIQALRLCCVPCQRFLGFVRRRTQRQVTWIEARAGARRVRDRRLPSDRLVVAASARAGVLCRRRHPRTAAGDHRCSGS